jgi:integrase
MPKRHPVKIIETVRSAALQRPLVPDVIWDSEISGFSLRVGRERGFWAIDYSPHGTNPSTGKRFGSTRLEIGDAFLTPIPTARAAALKAKADVLEGGDPHRDKMAARASQTAARGVLPATVSETLDAYERALATRQRPSEWTRRQSVRNARSACALMNALALPIGGINAAMVRLMVETTRGSDAQRQHLYLALGRFLGWALKQGLVERNVCGELDRDDRPKPSRAREHVPTIATLRSIWAAAADEGDLARDLLHLLLLTPLRRNEAAGLRWSEVDFAEGRIRIAAGRMKAGRVHELPLSVLVRALLERRRLISTGDLVFPTGAGTPYRDWNRLLVRVRRKIGEDKVTRDDRFSLHDIRRGFVSHLAGQFDVDALDQCLAHTRRGVAAVYQHSLRWPDRVRALDRWAELITGTESDSNVIPIAGRARA